MSEPSAWGRSLTFWTRTNLIYLMAVTVTGALVRLTSSGLGCTDWPACENFSPVGEAGFHSVIEFGNRLVSGLAIIPVIAAWLALRRTRPDLQRWIVALVAGFIGQVVLGMLVTRTELDPRVVLGHFLLSIVLVWLAAGLERGAVTRRHFSTVLDTSGRDPRSRSWSLREASLPATPGAESVRIQAHGGTPESPIRTNTGSAGEGPEAAPEAHVDARCDVGEANSVSERSERRSRAEVPRKKQPALARLTLATTGLAIVIGTLVTGSGPHTGSDESEVPVPRLGFDIFEVTRIHSIVVWVAVALMLWTLYQLKDSPRARRQLTVIVGLAAVQGGVGYLQYFSGVPEVLVAIHIAGAVTLWALLSLFTFEQTAASATGTAAETLIGAAT